MVSKSLPQHGSEPRVALVHEWLITLGGSELTLAQLRKIFPRADVFSLVDKLGDRERSFLDLGRITTSFLQSVPQIEKRYRAMLPLFPAAVRSLDVSDYDIVISSSHAVAKGVRTRPGQLHICLCYSPMRYAWDLREQYLRESGNDRGVRGALARALLGHLRRWDRKNSDDVDSFVAISQYIADRIQRAYHRSATVVYPPVDTTFYTPGRPDSRGEYFVTASRFVPYKRVDLIAAAFQDLRDRELIIVGTGPDEAKVRAAAGPNVKLVGHVEREQLRELLRSAAGFVFAAEEDFGIAPVEAQACGTPVVAFGRGGSLETVVVDHDPNRRTGVLFEEQTTECIAAAVRAFSIQTFSRDACRLNAERFSEERFRREFLGHVQSSWTDHRSRDARGRGL